METYDATKASGTPIPDGIYFVQGDGSAWTAREFRGGKSVGMTDEANAATHLAANDSWAGIVPAKDDELLDVTDEQLSIDIALACGYDDAYGVAVSRPSGDARSETMIPTETKAELTTLIETELRGMTARHGLLKMVAADVPTTLNQLTTEHYLGGPHAVAEIVERMVELGLIVPADTTRWWPSQMQTLDELLRDRPTVECKGNPPQVWMSDSGTGNRVCQAIASATAEALNVAIAKAKHECEARAKKTRQQIAAERDVDNS